MDFNLFDLAIIYIAFKILHYVGFVLLLLSVEVVGLFRPDFKEEAYSQLEK